MRCRCFRELRCVGNRRVVVERFGSLMVDGNVVLFTLAQVMLMTESKLSHS
jgi:hypothetical protein